MFDLSRELLDRCLHRQHGVQSRCDIPAVVDPELEALQVEVLLFQRSLPLKSRVLQREHEHRFDYAEGLQLLESRETSDSGLYALELPWALARLPGKVRPDPGDDVLRLWRERRCVFRVGSAKAPGRIQKVIPLAPRLKLVVEGRE